MKTAALLLLATLLTACASENIYEGLRAREAVRNPAPDARPAPQSSPSYQDYEAERKKLEQRQ